MGTMCRPLICQPGNDVLTASGKRCLGGYQQRLCVRGYIRGATGGRLTVANQAPAVKKAWRCSETAPVTCSRAPPAPKAITPIGVFGIGPATCGLKPNQGGLHYADRRLVSGDGVG